MKKKTLIKKYSITLLVLLTSFFITIAGYSKVLDGLAEAANGVVETAKEAITDIYDTCKSQNHDIANTKTSNSVTVNVNVDRETGEIKSSNILKNIGKAIAGSITGLHPAVMAYSAYDTVKTAVTTEKSTMEVDASLSNGKGDLKLTTKLKDEAEDIPIIGSAIVGVINSFTKGTTNSAYSAYRETKDLTTDNASYHTNNVATILDETGSDMSKYISLEGETWAPNGVGDTADTIHALSEAAQEDINTNKLTAYNNGCLTKVQQSVTKSCIDSGMSKKEAANISKASIDASKYGIEDSSEDSSEGSSNITILIIALVLLLVFLLIFALMRRKSSQPIVIAPSGGNSLYDRYSSGM